MSNGIKSAAMVYTEMLKNDRVARTVTVFDLRPVVFIVSSALL